MALNCSSSDNSSLIPAQDSPNSFHNLNVFSCFTIKSVSFILIFIVFAITTILLLLPLCIFILYLGFHQWKKNRFVSTVTMRYSDICTYHMVAMELIGISGSIILCCSAYTEEWRVILMGSVLFSVNWFGQPVFHILTCVDRYLAVVHPITYLSLKSENWVRRRNAVIGCVWLLSFVGAGLYTDQNLSNILDLCFLMVPMVIISFCSVSVLRVLTRPGPGEVGGERKQVNQLKLKAFVTMVTILGTLFLRFFCSGIWLIVFCSTLAINLDNCLIAAIDICSSLPSSLVVPLFFLHRTLKLQCCKSTG